MTKTALIPIADGSEEIETVPSRSGASPSSDSVVRSVALLDPVWPARRSAARPRRCSPSRTGEGYQQMALILSDVGLVSLAWMS
mgnify:CR=1 FL=1